jgi:hypothetical protein
MLINSFVFGVAYDTDAQAYINAVEAADTAAGVSGGLEAATKDAINAFVVGCKADGIWTAIKASCILAGARTLAGALVPLLPTMPAPTNNGFIGIGTDYNRKTGLVGDGSTKYLDSNRNNNADPQNSRHAAVRATVLNSSTNDRAYFGCADTTHTTQLLSSSTTPSRPVVRCASNSSTTLTGNLHASAGIFGVSRSSSSSYVARASGIDEPVTNTSGAPGSFPMLIFARYTGLTNNAPQLFSDSRLAFYSIGESLNLALLDARVTTLINAFSTAF